MTPRKTLFKIGLLALLLALLVVGGNYLERHQELFRDITEPLTKSESVLAFFSVIIINVILIFVLIFLTFRNFVKLVVERKIGVFGSSLRTKLISSFLFFSILPTIVLLYISSKFVNANFEKWLPGTLNVTIEKSIQNEEQYRTLIRDYVTESSTTNRNKDFEFTLVPLKASYVSSRGSSFLAEVEREVGNRYAALKSVPVIYPLSEVALLLVKRPEKNTIEGVLLPLPMEASWSNVLKGVSDGAPAIKLVRINYYMMLGAVTLLIIFSATWLGFTIARELTIPLQALAAASESVAQGNYDVKIDDFVSSDEMGRLARAFRSMVQDLEVAKKEADRAALEVQEKAKLAAWRDVARRIAHEMKNPLTPIRLGAQRLERRFSSRFTGDDKESFNDSLAVILQSTASITGLVDEFIKFARMPQPVLRSGNIVESVRLALAGFCDNKERVPLYFEYVDGDTSITEHLGYEHKRFPSLQIHYDHDQIVRLLVNLIANAISASAEKRSKVVVRMCVDSSTNTLLTQVIDWGCGVPDSVKAKIFEPYFSTKHTGTGLGLVIARQIVEEHGGRLWLEDNPEGGSMFSIQLPKV